MGALDDMLAAADPQPDYPGDPSHIVVQVGADGLITHPLPLPGGMTPEEWLAQLSDALGPGFAAAAVWTLAQVAGRTGTPVPTQAWAPVAT